MKGKKFTFPSYVCDQCGGRYSRKWVLQRHFLTQHPGQSLQQSASGPPKHNKAIFDNEFIINMMMLTSLKKEIDYLHARLVGTNESVLIQNGHEKLLAFALTNTSTLNSLQQALKMSQDYWMYMQENFFLIPKSDVARFSGFVCVRCLSAEPTLPIKNLGCDFTAQARHQCKPENVQTRDRPRVSNTDMALKQLRRFSAGMILNLIDRWSNGVKDLWAKKIDVKPANDTSMVDILSVNYHVPYRYYITKPVFLSNSPWLSEVLDYGFADPSTEQIIDFCTWCNGTYAIVPVVKDGRTDYYDMKLTLDSVTL